MDPWLPALAGAALLLLLAFRLRGPRGGRDLTGPPKRRRRRITAAEARRLAELVGRGEAEEARRLIRQAGYDEAEAKTLVGLVVRLEGAEEEEGGRA